MSEQPVKPGTGAKLSRKELDRIEAEMIKGRFERREYAGDPQQPERLRVRLLRNLRFLKK